MTQKNDSPNTEKSTQQPTVRARKPRYEQAVKSGKKRGFTRYLLLGAAMAVIIGGIWSVEKGHLEIPAFFNSTPYDSSEPRAEAQDITRTEGQIPADVMAVPPRIAPDAPVALSPAIQDDRELRHVKRQQERARREQAELKKQLQAAHAEISALAESVKALTIALEKQKNEPTTIAVTTQPANDTALRVLEGKIETLSKQLDGLRQDYAAENAASQQRLRLLQTLDKAEQAAKSGKSYAAFVPAIERLSVGAGMADGGALITLREEADIAPPTLAQLMDEFRNTAALALPYAIAAGDTATWQDAIRSNFAHVVSIRKVEVSSEDNSDEAHIARAEAELQHGNITLALAHLEQLSDEPKAVFASWTELAQRFQSVQQAFAQLREQALRNSGGK